MLLASFILSAFLYFDAVQGTTAVVGSAPQEDDGWLKEQMVQHSRVIAADGGASHLYRIDVLPEMAVGDFDSVGTVGEIAQIIKAPRVKDETDMEMALRQLPADEVVYCYAAVGGRMDHTLYNCYLALRHPHKLFLRTADETVFGLDSGSTTLCSEEAQQICFVPLAGPFVLNGEIISRPYFASFNREQTVEIEGRCLCVLGKGVVFSLMQTLDQLSGSLKTPYETVTLLEPGTAHFSVGYGRTISLMPYWGEAKGIFTRGLGWEFGGSYTALDASFLSLSNVAVQDEIDITFTEGPLLLMIDDLVDVEMADILSCANKAHLISTEL